MKWVVIVLVIVVAIVAIMFLIGYFMPVKHTASHTVRLKARPPEVWSFLTNPSDYKKWRSGLKEVHVMDPYHWTEKSDNGTIHYESEWVKQDEFLVSRITNKDLPFGGFWTFTLAPEPDGTKLTITEEGEVYNPLFRFLSKYIFGHTATIKAYAADLAKATY